MIDRPNTWVRFQDHHKDGERNLLSRIFNVIEELELDGFYYRKSTNEMIFDLKMEFKENWREHGLMYVE